tara:strand:- start:290 stop:556 length:267 start_codon:yes stop_codon:yes gene_type:complete
MSARGGEHARQMYGLYHNVRNAHLLRRRRSVAVLCILAELDKLAHSCVILLYLPRYVAALHSVDLVRHLVRAWGCNRSEAHDGEIAVQ